MSLLQAGQRECVSIDGYSVANSNSRSGTIIGGGPHEPSEENLLDTRKRKRDNEGGQVMVHENVIYQKEEGVAKIIMNRPAVNKRILDMRFKPEE